MFIGSRGSRSHARALRASAAILRRGRHRCVRCDIAGASKCPPRPGHLDDGRTAAPARDEIAALRAGVDLGMTLIDTAEMYGEGATEELVGEAIAGFARCVPREQGVPAERLARSPCPAPAKRACGGSAPTGWTSICSTGAATCRWPRRSRRWRGWCAGKILHWGVSNLDTDDMEELEAAGGGACATDQILYNLTRRGPEHDLLPWLAGKAMPAMAYSPVEQGRLVDDRRSATSPKSIGATPAQVALAWSMRQRRRDRDPQGRQRRACARKPGGRRSRPPATSSRGWTRSFRRRAAACRWRCLSARGDLPAEAPPPKPPPNPPREITELRDCTRAGARAAGLNASEPTRVRPLT